MTIDFVPAFQLSCGVQSYAWGKIGASSKAAQYGTTTPGFTIDEKTPYAELWMGTHPSCPSQSLANSTLLSTIIASDPTAYLGSKIVAHFGPDMPYLFKVLAIGKALSIQAHPSKKLAEKLNAERPDVYKDANHKPEMALAITPFEGFCGFRPLSSISTYLTSVPELAALIGPQALSTLVAIATPSIQNLDDATASPAQKVALKQVFEALMTAPDDLVKEELAKLVARYKAGGTLVSEDEKAEEGLTELVLQLESEFPGDVGVFCAFLLNVVKLQAGEAVFLRADEPHAYISGDIIECMATSDNVVRAGLTPKLRDVPTLVSMLTYITAPPDAQLMSPTSFRSLPNTLLYDPPIEEFSVLHTKLAANVDEAQPGVDGPSILIVTNGAGELVCEGIEGSLKEGSVWFVAAGKEVKLKANGGEEGLQVYRAFVEAPESS
ncbi:mannose-6-phosphate isomerase [Mrakia frigida]|uniref:mannose-6-phosphate isomerase PMI40 n=1 Tax=Mrakia frigida TaxID=29902 RepID=UPI003FCC198F